MNNAWNGFTGGDWQNEINVRDFIQKNYTPYEGDGAFLAPATARTTKMREKFDNLKPDAEAGVSSDENQ